MPGPYQEFYIGYISIFAGNYTPAGWLDCDGALVEIQKYPALYSLLGTHFGGNGHDTFALPDLRGRIPIGQGTKYALGDQGGTKKITIPLPAMPAHNHLLNTLEGQGTSTTGENMLTAKSSSRKPVKIYGYNSDINMLTMEDKAIGQTGDGDSFDLMPAYTTVRFCICADGVYPPRN